MKKNKKGYKIPDLSQAVVVGEPRYDDLTDKIDGAETRVDHYTLNGKDIWKVSINDNVFLYGIGTKAEKGYAIADLDGDGIFETKYNTKELTYTGEKIDGKIPDFPAKKDLPPEWVLNNF